MHVIAQAAPAAAAAVTRRFSRRAGSTNAVASVPARAAAGMGSRQSAVQTGAAVGQQRLLSRAAGRVSVAARAAATGAASDDEHMRIVAEKVAKAARNMKTLSWVGFWGQLILSTVSGVIIFFSVVFKGVTKARISARSAGVTSCRSSRGPQYLSHKIAQSLLPPIRRATPACPPPGHRRRPLLRPLRPPRRLPQRLLVHGVRPRAFFPNLRRLPDP